MKVESVDENVQVKRESMMEGFEKRYRIKPGSKFELKDIDPSSKQGVKDREACEKAIARSSEWSRIHPK